MTGLWLIFAGMVLFAVATLLRPLMQDRTNAAAPSAAHDLEVYRDQLRELERERAEGRIDAEEAKGARLEIERRILAADRAASERDQRPYVAMPRLALAVTILIPAAAGLLYFTLGAPETATGGAERDEQADANRQDRAAMIRGMVTRLENRLQTNPEDPEGWRLLGRSYFVLGRREDAVRAYGRAATLAPEDTGILSDYATVLIRSAPEATRPPERAVPVLRRLLSLDENNPLALYFLGIAEARSGNLDAAREHWRRLMRRLPDEAPLRDDLNRRLEALDNG